MSLGLKCSTVDAAINMQRFRFSDIVWHTVIAWVMHPLVMVRNARANAPLDRTGSSEHAAHWRIRTKHIGSGAREQAEPFERSGVTESTTL